MASLVSTEQVGGLGVVLAAIGEHQKIVLPAILRYVFGGCCKDPTHAPNTSLPTHSTSALAEHVRQRNTIIRKLHDLKTQHHKVLDILSTFSATSSNFPEKCASLKKYCIHPVGQHSPDG